MKNVMVKAMIGTNPRSCGHSLQPLKRGLQLFGRSLGFCSPLPILLDDFLRSLRHELLIGESLVDLVDFFLQLSDLFRKALPLGGKIDHIRQS